MTASKSLQLLVLALVLAVNVWPPSEASDEPSGWEQYKRDFNKSYASPEEEAFRRELFTAELRRIQLHNSDSRETSKLGLDHMSDWTEQEFERLNGLASMPLGGLGDRDNWQPDPFLAEILNSEGPVPEELDWRRYRSRVSGVKDQGMCGSCWAFATTGLLEGQMVARGSVRRMIPLSEQQLIDCRDGDGCRGGSVEEALESIARLGGIMSDHDYDYKEKSGQCSIDSKQFTLTKKGSHVALFPLDEAQMQKVVARYGPISVYVASSSWKGYKSGVWPGSLCTGLMNHAVLIVGYGRDDFDQDYWLVKNSWGSYFGEGGYIKIKRGVNACMIAQWPLIVKF